jgi:hypothetical protein
MCGNNVNFNTSWRSRTENKFIIKKAFEQKSRKEYTKILTCYGRRGRESLFAQAGLRFS